MSVKSYSHLDRELFESYDKYKLTEIISRRFTQSDMLRWLKPPADKRLFESEPIGQSAEGRTISLLTIGTGKTKVLIWSQMHGDEPTATMALLDIINFFDRNPSHPVTEVIREKLTLLIIPMLNPDGAERFTRRTAQLIDMNRDALALVTPEARILKTVQSTYQPEFGFNLHDQDPRFTVGTTKKVTAIALLAPATDESRSDNPVRMRAKHVASVFAEIMNHSIPGHLAKWDDTFEPRAFGDNVQKWGTSTVLVESGGWLNDRDKMFLRKLNCVGLLVTLATIADGSYARSNLATYEQLPFNTKFVYDLIIRNAQFSANGETPMVHTDVGINFDEVAHTKTLNVELLGKIMDFGDLSVFTAFEEVDGSSLRFDSSQIQIERVLTLDDIKALLNR